MSDAAGSVNIVLSVNKANFTAAMADAQRQLDKFAGKSKSSGHSAVTSVQAVSASLRTLHGGFEQNLRSMERWVAQSKTATAVAKMMFPLVGAATFGFLIGEIGVKVADFIKKANAMPKAIQQGFASMQLASQSSTDALRLTNDELQNSINKLEGKPQNNLAIEFDEARVAADKLATSIENSNNKLNDLLSKNHLSGWSLLLGKMGTADRQGTVKAFGDQSDSNAYDLANATASGNKDAIARAQKALRDTQNAELANMRNDLATRQANAKNPGAFNDSANIAIDKGVITAILNQQAENAEQVRNADLEAKNKKLQADKAARAAALEAQKAANAAAIKAEETAHTAWAAIEDRSIADEAAYWAQRVAATKTGSAAFIYARTAMLKEVIAQNRQNAETISKFSSDYMSSLQKTSGLSDSDSKKLDDSGKDSVSFIASLRQFIDLNRQNSTALAENSLQMAVATGQMSKLDAARALSAIHQQDYIKGLQQLKDEAAAIAADPTLSGVARKAALQDNANRTSQYQMQGGIQAAQDRLATNPGSSSALVGATDALNEFVAASRDAAGMMRDIVTNVLGGFNQALVGTITGQRGGFKQFGLGVTRNIASKGLETAEGSVLGAFGFGGGGKLGTKGNPMYVISASSGETSALSSLIPSGKGGGITGFFGGLLKSFLPHFANGGPISGPSIVGEAGEELFVPSTSGTIIPNHQLSTAMSSSGGGQNISYSIDARGTDAVQVQQRVQTAIVAAHQSSVKAAVKQVHQQSARQPQRSR